MQLKVFPTIQHALCGANQDKIIPAAAYQTLPIIRLSASDVKLQWRRSQLRKIWMKIKSAVGKSGIICHNPAARMKVTQAVACALEECIAYEVSPRTVAAYGELSEKLGAELIPVVEGSQESHVGEVFRALILPWTENAEQFVADSMVVEHTKTIVVP
jgi:hypothetical protein